MPPLKTLFHVSLACCLLQATALFSAVFDPDVLFLTWTQDPLRSMTVVWVEPVDNDYNDVIFVKPEKAPDDAWTPAFADRSTTLPDKKQRRHVVELTRLKPSTSYEFRFHAGGGPVYRFRTAPDINTEPLRFAIGGDVYYYNPERCHEMNLAVARTDPHFVVLGGDIAYSTDKLGIFGDQGDRWYDFLSMFKRDMVSPDGYLIPMIPAIGNHDTVGRYGQPYSSAPFFYALFPFPGIPGYGAVDFGDELSLIILDSGHTNDVAGPQKKWLEAALADRSSVPHRFAVYHVPAFPSRTRKLPKVTAEIRRHWVPLFDTYGLIAAFEHHEHTYKRTVPIRYETEDPEGTLYLGDGAWGVTPREPFEPGELWYLAETRRTNHVLIVTLTKERRLYMAMDENGVVFDQIEQTVK